MGPRKTKKLAPARLFLRVHDMAGTHVSPDKDVHMSLETNISDCGVCVLVTARRGCMHTCWVISSSLFRTGAIFTLILLPDHVVTAEPQKSQFTPAACTWAPASTRTDFPRVPTTATKESPSTSEESGGWVTSHTFAWGWRSTCYAESVLPPPPTRAVRAPAICRRTQNRGQHLPTTTRSCSASRRSKTLSVTVTFNPDWKMICQIGDTSVCVRRSCTYTVFFPFCHVYVDVQYI